MPSLPPINATTPLVQPSVPSVTYNVWQMTMLHIDATDVANNKYAVVANLSRAVDNGDGTISISPTAAPVVINIPDLYAAAAADTSGALATAMGAVIEAIIAIGTAESLL